MKPQKNKNHYLPKFYVGNFGDEDKNVHVLDHTRDRIFYQSRSRTFHGRNMYTIDFEKYEKRDPVEAQKLRESLGVDHIDISGIVEDPDMIENLLMECEDISAKIIQKIIAGESITQHERVELSMFIALMYTRNPTFLEFARSLEKHRTREHLDILLSSPTEVRSFYEEMKKKEVYKDMSEDEFVSMISEVEIDIEIPQEAGLQTMLIGSTIIDQMIYNKTWVLIRAPKGTTFITSDMPVFIDYPEVYKKGIFGAGFETPKATVVFPLSKEYMIIMEDRPIGPAIINASASKKMVRELNKKVFSMSRNYVVARDKAHLENLKKDFTEFVPDKKP